MKVHVSDYLRKIALAIEIDSTPSEKDLEEVKESRRVVNPPVKKVTNTRVNDDTVEHDVVKPTARPKIKPPRRDPASKPSVWDSKSHRKEYMRQWRSEGKDVETGNKYVKKNK